MEPLSALFREGLAVTAVVGGPLFLVLFGVGLAIGVLQAATQINDPAVGFLPRVLSAFGVCALLGPWMVERLAGFLHAALERLAQGG